MQGGRNVLHVLQDIAAFRALSIARCVAQNFLTHVQYACESGTYSLGAATACSACPIGYQCIDATAAPIPCSAGSYNTQENSTACTACPSGSQCPLASTSPTPCTPGFWSLPGSANCTACSAGFACPNQDRDKEQPCLGNTWSTGGASSCQECPVGFYCPDSTTSPKTCPHGMYNLQSNQSSCISCPIGFRCPFADQAPIQCEAGYYSLGGNDSCSPCQAGFMCPSGQLGDKVYTMQLFRTYCLVSNGAIFTRWSKNVMFDMSCGCSMCRCRTTTCAMSCWNIQH